MAGITIAQLAQLETDAYKKGVMLSLLRYAPVMESLPFANISSLSIRAKRWEILPTGGAWRKLNEGYTSSEDGQIGEVEEALYTFGGDITFDRILDMVTNVVENPQVAQTKAKLRSMALDWNYAFINGDHASDEDSIEGLKKRVASLPSRQSIYFTAATSSAPLDPTASAANGRRFYDIFDKGVMYCNAGQADAIYCNQDFIWGMGKAARYMQTQGNFLDVTKDSLEREVTTWKGVPLVDMGFKKDMSTEVIPNTETAGDAGADSTSVYIVSHNTEEGISGIQLNNFDVYDPLNGGEMESKPSKLRRVDWVNGLAGFGSYGIVRLRNLAAPSSWT